MTKNKKNQFSKSTAGLYVRFLVPLFQKNTTLTFLPISHSVFLCDASSILLYEEDVRCHEVVQGSYKHSGVIGSPLYAQIEVNEYLCWVESVHADSRHIAKNILKTFKALNIMKF